MKSAIKKAVLAVATIAVAVLVFTSCQRHTCPTYSKVDSTETSKHV